MWDICQECCQIKTEDKKCFCNGDCMKKRYLGLVDGCTVYTGNKRCKKSCEKRTDICSKHYINITTE